MGPNATVHHLHIPNQTLASEAVTTLVEGGRSRARTEQREAFLSKDDWMRVLNKLFESYTLTPLMDGIFGMLMGTLAWAFRRSPGTGGGSALDLVESVPVISLEDGLVHEWGPYWIVKPTSNSAVLPDEVERRWLVTLLGVILTIAVSAWRAHAPRWLAHDLVRELRTNEFLLTQIRDEVQMHLVEMVAPRWKQKRVKDAITMPWPKKGENVMNLGHVMEYVAEGCSSTVDGFWSWKPGSPWLSATFAAFNGVHISERKKAKGSEEDFKNPLVLLDPVKLKEKLGSYTSMSYQQVLDGGGI